MAKHQWVNIPYTRMSKALAEVLQNQGFVEKVEHLESEIKITLKYSGPNSKPAITGLKRVSKPGLRVYSKSPSFSKTVGVTIFSTSRGLLVDHAARKANIGGEVLCSIW
jgi:small subunit ribosomal protein S8